MINDLADRLVGKSVSTKWTTSHYAFHDLILEIRQKGEGTDLSPYLQDFSFFPAPSPNGKISFTLSLSQEAKGWAIPQDAEEVFRFDELSGHTLNRDFYLQEGSSILYLPYGKRWGEGFIPPRFLQNRPLSRQRFWGVGLVKLLRPFQYFALHGAGLVTPQGQGVLISGVSGSGKSTLSIGLIRHGWGYLSDDAVLLRMREEGVKALVFRQPFSIESKRAEAYSDFTLGKEPPPCSRKLKQRLYMQEAYPSQHVPECLPQILLFPKIVSCTTSRLEPVTRNYAFTQLLAQSTPELFDQSNMKDHLEVLTQLIKQCQIYELQAGLDLYHQPETLQDLLAKEKGTA